MTLSLPPNEYKNIAKATLDLYKSITFDYLDKVYRDTPGFIGVNKQDIRFLYVSSAGRIKKALKTIRPNIEVSHIHSKKSNKGMICKFNITIKYSIPLNQIGNNTNVTRIRLASYDFKKYYVAWSIDRGILLGRTSHFNKINNVI